MEEVVGFIETLPVNLKPSGFNLGSIDDYYLHS